MAISHQMIGVDEVRAAGERIARLGVTRTPIVRLNVDDAPAEIYLKLENLQLIGSFKIRGMTNAIELADPAAVARGVWTVSAGNAGQGVAWNARRLGVSCSVVVPESAPDAKASALQRLGASIVRLPFEDWLAVAGDRRFEGLEGLFVHPFSDPAVMAGNGTIALEILDELPDVDVVLVPWGGGGLCCGIASLLRRLAPNVRIFACEFSPTAPLEASLAAGTPTEVPYQASFVDGIGAPFVFPEMFDLARLLIDGSLSTSLNDVAEALRLVVRRNHVVPEGAAAVPVAVALTGAAGTGRVVCVVSGGNIDQGTLAHILTDGASE
jgi:threonine dehydratase